eukprot:SAG31_NODE_352_length_17229_cov_9.658669_1_plen_178_part_00
MVQLLLYLYCYGDPRLAVPHSAEVLVRSRTAAAGATYSCPRARPQPETDKYGLQYLFLRSRPAPRRRGSGSRGCQPSIAESSFPGARSGEAVAAYALCFGLLPFPRVCTRPAATPRCIPTACPRAPLRANNRWPVLRQHTTVSRRISRHGTDYKTSTDRRRRPSATSTRGFTSSTTT